MKTLVPFLCTLLLVGCNDNAPSQKASSLENTNVITQEVNTTTSNAPQAVVVPQTTQSTTATTKKVESTPVIESKPAEKPSDKIKTESKKSSVPTVAQEVKEKPAQVNASALYGEKCASCHGPKAEKQALGKSQVIAGWSTSKIEDALHGYQSGSYGKEMKTLMAGQAKSLSGEQIKSLAKYISTL